MRTNANDPAPTPAPGRSETKGTDMPSKSSPEGNTIATDRRKSQALRLGDREAREALGKTFHTNGSTVWFLQRAVESWFSEPRRYYTATGERRAVEWHELELLLERLRSDFLRQFDS